MPSCGPLRRETRPQHAETEIAGIVTQNRSGCQRRARFVNYEASFPCEPLRFARWLFPLAAAARKCDNTNLTNSTQRACSNSVFRSMFPPFPPAGPAILRNRNGPRVGNGARSMWGVRFGLAWKFHAVPRLILFSSALWGCGRELGSRRHGRLRRAGLRALHCAKGLVPWNPFAAALLARAWFLAGA